MKQFVLVIVLAVAFSGVAVAGDYHTGNTLTCSQCHVMHASQAHDYDGGAFSGTLPAAAQEMLLRESVNNLCLSCHDGSSAMADVLGTNSGSHVRAAGALNYAGDTGDYGASHGHSLGSEDQAPGGNFQDSVTGLNCIHCHNPHGYGGEGVNPWRNLYNGGTAITYEIDTYTGTVDVTQETARIYSWDSLRFNKPTEGESAYANYCASCHGNFHGTGNTGAGPTNFVRHPAQDVVIGAVGGNHSELATYTGHANQVLTQVADVFNASPTPSCFSCHKGHGNKNAFGLIFMTGVSGGVTEEGQAGGSATSLCGQCHVQ